MNSDFASFATLRFSTLTTISGHLKGIVSHKNIQYYKLYVYFNLCVYISRDFSLPLAIEMYIWVAIWPYLHREYYRTL